MSSDPPRVAVEVTREELIALQEWNRFKLWWAEEDVDHDRAAYHRAREAELRKVMEGMDG